jgi:hypothetical protein
VSDNGCCYYVMWAREPIITWVTDVESRRFPTLDEARAEAGRLVASGLHVHIYRVSYGTGHRARLVLSLAPQEAARCPE